MLSKFLNGITLRTTNTLLHCYSPYRLLSSSSSSLIDHCKPPHCSPNASNRQFSSKKNDNLINHSRHASPSSSNLRPFSSSKSLSPSPSSSGLYGIEILPTPSSLISSAHKAVEQATSYRDDLVNSSISPSAPHSEILMKLHALDAISSTLCLIIDSSELTRSIHPSKEWRNAASQSFTIISQYINILNGDEGLYKVIERLSLIICDESSTFSSEEIRFTKNLLSEFKRDGIHLPSEQRLMVLELQNDIVELETLFSTNIVEQVNDGFYKINDDTGFCARVFGVDNLKMIRDHYLNNEEEKEEEKEEEPNTVYLTTNPYFTNTLLKYHPISLIRKQVYIQSNSVALDNVDVLDNLIAKRNEVAHRLGFGSYCLKVLGDKMAGSKLNDGDSDENLKSSSSSKSSVQRFLDLTREKNGVKFEQEMTLLSKIKQTVERGTAEESKIQSWDMQYYMNIYKQQLDLKRSAEVGNARKEDISHYFSVDDVITGLGIITKEVFGASMEEGDIGITEGWDDESFISSSTLPPSSSHTQKLKQLGVRKFKLVDIAKNEDLGTIYFDLYPRTDKYTHAAHFTVRCGCKVFDINDASKVVDQLPIVALVTNFSPPNNSNSNFTPSLLSHSEVETLFHEFGHALHSLMSRTKYQHLSGTRGPVDFVETPSHLLEYFSSDSETVSKFAKHYKSRDAIPIEYVNDLNERKHQFSAIDKQMQCLYAEFDQVIFGASNGGEKVDPAKVLQLLHAKYNLPYADNTFWHAKFGHLVTYGGVYYAYLWAQAIANDIVVSMKKEEGGILNEKAGERIKGLLKPGASKDPFAILKECLGREWRAGGIKQNKNKS